MSYKPDYDKLTKDYNDALNVLSGGKYTPLRRKTEHQKEMAAYHNKTSSGGTGIWQEQASGISNITPKQEKSSFEQWNIEKTQPQLSYGQEKLVQSYTSAGSPWFDVSLRKYASRQGQASDVDKQSAGSYNKSEYKSPAYARQMSYRGLQRNTYNPDIRREYENIAKKREKTIDLNTSLVNSLQNISKGINTNNSISNYGVYPPNGATVFGIKDKRYGRQVNGRPVGVPVLRVDSPHKNVEYPHVNYIDTDLYSDLLTKNKNTNGIRGEHVKIPQYIYDVSKTGGKILKAGQKGSKVLGALGTAADLYEFGTTAYEDLHDEDKKLGKKTAKVTAGIGGGWAGGAGGATLGGKAGAALGTFIAPGVGTVVGGVLGGLAGGIGGAFGGDMLGRYAVEKLWK